MTQTTTAPRTRTITLSRRRPVTVREDQWPIIASAHGDSCARRDVTQHQQAVARGECDEYTLRVRQHADGRTLVYGVLDAAIAAWGQPAGGQDRRGGELLAPGADLPAAIRRVGEDCHLPDHLIRACVADLQPEEL